MAKFKLEITETLSRVVEVEADTYDDALEQVTEQYNNADIVLDWEDSQGTDIKEYHE